MRTSQEKPITAAELMALIEDGKEDEALAIIQSLNRMDFIRLYRSAQTLERGLSDYALSWKGAEYWGNGTEFPTLAKAA